MDQPAVTRVSMESVRDPHMASSKLSGIRIAGIASAVPVQTRVVQDEVPQFGEDVVRKVAESIGVQTRRVAPPGVCASDLCCAAAERLLAELNWPRNEIGGLIFVTQTPDYVLPATSHVLHERLGLAPSAFAFDVNLGCSGYVYGLWMAASLIQTVGTKVLLLVGDTISRTISEQDLSVALLFGDAGTATALEPDPDAPPAYFELGADGSGARSLIIPAGGFRRPRDESSSVRTRRELEGLRSDEDLYMDGPEIFSFALRRVPPLVQAVLACAGLGIDEIDSFVFHQANGFMLSHLAKRLRIPGNRLVVGLGAYGNTSSASIPLAITTSGLRAGLESRSMTLLLAGFGVGFSWGAAVVRCGPSVLPSLVEYTGSDTTDALS
jgi:3-oxoacyl-[acyl-carrier-protein] synthase III